MRSQRNRTEFICADTSKCKACWACIDECNNGVLGKANLWFHKHVVIKNAEKCCGCTRCIAVCPNEVFEAVMGNASKIKLGSVQKTLLLPLWGRAIETRKQKPLLVDNKAVSIITSIAYDFTVFSKNISKSIQYSWIARSIYFDQKIKTFLDLYPEATIINIGCGLDTTFDRVDNGKIQWIDLDLPDTIELRRKYISESNRRLFVPKSVFDKSWYDRIERKNNAMILIAGVLYYFDEKDVKGLFDEFHTFLPGAEIIFDYASRIGIKILNKRVMEKGEMEKSAFLKWGTNNILEIEKWNSNFKVISNMPMFKEHKKNYSLIERIGMNVSDILKIISLAHMKIN